VSGPPVYLFGLPELSHPGGSRYLGFRRHLDARTVASPVKFRFFSSYWGWRADAAITTLTRRPYYTLGLFLIEGTAAVHMLGHRRFLYHAVKGDSDLWFLPRVSRLTDNLLVASFHEPPSRLKFWAIHERITRHLAGAILLAASQRSHFATLLPSERIFVVPHGVDTDHFRPAERTCDEPICITVGSHLRDADTITRAMEFAWRENPRVRLIVVGTRRPTDANAPPELEDPRVQFLDYLGDPELLHAYQASRVAILSLTDAVANNALLEAMACALPVVATDVGGVR